MSFSAQNEIKLISDLQQENFDLKIKQKEMVRIITEITINHNEL